MKVADRIVFDRKNYYYSDLSKGFQITQTQTPVGIDGFFTFPFQNQDFKAHIKQIQIEEDTAKQTRTEHGFLLDYNRAGVGLIEIVTTPCFHSADTVCAYLSYLQQTLVWCGISQADMSRGSLRCDVNLSLRKINSTQPGVVVEIKNLNSLKNIRSAINYEIQRQQTLLLQSQVILKETRRFNEQTQQTQSTRMKQTNALYRFIVEPNIHPIALTKSYVQKITAQCPTAPLT